MKNENLCWIGRPSHFEFWRAFLRKYDKLKGSFLQTKKSPKQNKQTNKKFMVSFLLILNIFHTSF